MSYISNVLFFNNQANMPVCCNGVYNLLHSPHANENEQAIFIGFNWLGPTL